MSDLRTGAIEVTEEALTRNPELRALVNRIGGVATEGGVRVVPRSAEEASRLQHATEAVGLQSPTQPTEDLHRTIANPSKFDTTGGPVPADRALSTEVRSGTTVGGPREADVPFHPNDVQWGEHNPPTGYGVPAESADRPQAALPMGAREQHISDMGLTDPVFRRGLAEQLKYAEHLKGTALNPEEMAVETRKFTNTFDRGEGRPSMVEAPTGRDPESKSAGFDESLDRGMGNLGETTSTRGLTSREKLGIGAAGLTAAGYAAASGGVDSLAAKSPPAEVGPPSSAARTSAAPGGAGTQTPATPSTGEVTVPRGAAADHISGATVRAEQIKKDPAFLNKEIDDLDTEIGKLADAKKDITPTDEAIWKKQREDLLTLARDSRQRNDWADVAEKFAHAITQMGAAMAGLRNGVDMSGLKFDSTDWRAKNEQIMAELRQGLDIQDKDETGTRKTVGDARAAYERLMERRRSAVEKKGDYEQGVDRDNMHERNKAAADTAGNQQRASEANLHSDDAALDRDSRERIEEGREAREAKRAARTVHAGAAKADYDQAAKQAKALQDAAGIIATTKGKRALYDKAQFQIGKALGDAGLGTDWADAQAKAADANSIGDGKDDSDFLLEDLKARAQAAAQRAEQARVKWSQMEAGGAAPQSPPPAAAGAKAPYGDTVTQKGVVYKWNGTTYVPAK